MPQLLALEECLGTSSGEGGLMIEGIVLVASGFFDLMPSETRPRFFLATVAAVGTAAKLEVVGRDGPAAAQNGSAIV